MRLPALSIRIIIYCIMEVQISSEIWQVIAFIFQSHSEMSIDVARIHIDSEII
jgi:hypothetical protein